MNNEDRSADRDPLDVLAEEFIGRYRRGERPSVLEYEKEHPELAEELHELLPALVMMEDVRPRSHDVPNTPHEDEAGGGLNLERIGDYRILREVGRGGMGIVYEAEQESLGRHVALKVLPKHALLEPRQLERFRREARAAARLHHTNIVPVFGTGEDDGLHYHVMQFIQGLGLDEVLIEVARLREVKVSGSRGQGSRRQCSDNGMSRSAVQVAQSLIAGNFQSPADAAANSQQPPVSQKNAAAPAIGNGSEGNGRPDSSSSKLHLPGQDVSTTESGVPYWRSVARIGVQVAEALAYANGQGVLHRDIKPSNLLLDSDGTVWVSDFGLAKASESDDLTHTGDIVGTLRYLAPERLHGQGDARSDIYSLGITLYELLTLRHPFAESDRTRLVRQIADEEPRRPRSIDRALPRDLETIVIKAIAKRPADRYQTAASLAADLRSFLEDKPIQARRIGRTERYWRSIRRNPIVSTLTAAVVLLAVIVGGVVAVTHAVINQRNRAIEAEQEARFSQERAEQAEREVKIRSHLAQATAHRRSGRMGQRFKCLEELTAAVKLGPSPELKNELREEAIAALGLSDLRILVDRPVGVLTGAQCDHQIQRYASVDIYGSGAVIVRRLDNDQEVLRVPAPEVPYWYATTDFTPDGRYLLVCYFERNGIQFDVILDVWHIERQERVATHPIRSNDMIGTVRAHEGRLYFVNRQSELCVWDLELGRELRRLPLGMVPYGICVDAQGKRVAINEHTAPLLRILDLETGDELASWSTNVGTRAMAWSADGQLLATGDSNNRVFVRHVESGEVISVLEGEVLRMAFAHHGHLIAMSGWDGTTQLWDAATGTKLVEAVGQMVRFSEDDRQLAFLHNRGVGIWEVAHAIESRSLRPNAFDTARRDSSAMVGSSFSGDGRFLAISTVTGISLFDRHTGDELVNLDCGYSAPVLFRSDGSGLLTNLLGEGLYYWPMRNELLDGAEVVHIGPPRLVQPLTSDNFIPMAWLPGEQAVVVADNSNRCILVVPIEPNATTAEPIVLPSEHGRITSVGVTQDGRWIAAGGWKERGIQLWDLPNRRFERILPHGDSPTATGFFVFFSPDDRWLFSATRAEDSYGFFAYRVGTWERGITKPAEFGTKTHVVFSADRSVMALNVSSTQVVIADTHDGRELLRLTNTHFKTWPMAFSRDGADLVLGAGRFVTWWNLSRLDSALRKLDLEPGAPDERSELYRGGADMPETADKHNAVAAAPLSVAIELGDFQNRTTANRRRAGIELGKAALYKKRQSWASARAAIERSLQATPDNDWAHNSLAWLLATCPDRSYRDSHKAVASATRAVELQPGNADYRNTLGIAHYRTGNLRDAITELTSAEELDPGRWSAHNGFFLAMAYWQLGDQSTAHEWFKRAIEWCEKNKAHQPNILAEVRQFRGEAEEILGIQSSDQQ